GLDRARIEMQAGEDFGDGYRMRDVRIAATALLPFVSLGAVLVSGRDARHARARKIGLELGHEPPEIVGAPYRRQTNFAEGGTIVHGGFFLTGAQPAPRRGGGQSPIEIGLDPSRSSR